ncbi:S41 family peptidase [Chitinivorax sp. B]|uniref:S41 family peptidase n=1 Tax=Chitinivorax sp. B TaxID=2502235 RepID=UPI0010F6E366|nr:S41 family peptidase [Chitinivorax sp. B]
MRNNVQKFSLVSAGVVVGVLLSLNFSAIADKAEPQPLPVEDLRAFTDVFGRIKADYVEPVEDKKLIREAINGMLSGLDPHSAYLDENAFKDLRESTQGEFGGLGLEVGMEDGVVKVISPIEDSPAYKAGMKAGDYIIKLDDTNVRGLSLTDAVKKMRGKPNTSITLTVLRKSESKPLTFTLTRSVIKVQSVRNKLLDDGYGYVRVSQFQEHTVEDLAKAVDSLYKQNKGALKGFVLDLRNDPGGLLDAAVGVSAAFLPANTLVVYTDGRVQDAKMRRFTVKDDYARRGDDPLKNLPKEIKNVPLVVLVNGGSASASEIVAGALQDHKRAIVVGTQTFGKGSVQTVLPLSPNTGIKLTTARYYTPNGRSIQAKGIVPDVEVEEARLSAVDGFAGLRVREADLTGHLENTQESNTDKPSDKAKDKEPAKPAAKPKAPTNKPDRTDDAKVEGPIEFGSKQDYQLQQALNVLKVQQIVVNKMGSKS